MFIEALKLNVTILIYVCSLFGSDFNVAVL